MADFDSHLRIEVVVTNDAQLRAVYAVLANPSLADPLLLKNFVQAKSPIMPEVSRITLADLADAGDVTHTDEPDENPPETEVAAEPVLDSAGVPFDETIHTGTRNKSGTWRLKKGAVAPEPAAAETAPSTSTANSGEDSTQSEDAAEPTAEAEADDEFAAFTAAANEQTSDEEWEAAAPLARTWTDADLGALCNQAAVKLGDPAPVKELIAKFVPADTVPHSRNIPVENREEFAQAIEARAEIEFAG